MQFTLRFLLLTFLLVALCLAIFDCAGPVIALALAGAAAYARGTRLRGWATLALILLLGLVLRTFVPVLRAAREAARRSATVRYVEPFPDASQIALGLRNYRDRFGSLPPVQERDAEGHPRHSWRVAIPPYQDQGPEEYWQWLSSQYHYEEAWNGPNNRRLAATHPSTASWLAVVSEKGDWLQPTAATNPVQVVENRNQTILWHEPRDLTVDEACQAIHVPMPGSLLQRLMADDIPDYYAVLADGQELRIPVHAPPNVLRAVLLGDRTQQGELGVYRRSYGRMQWYDYLTLAGLVTCWVALLRTAPPEPATCPSDENAAEQPA